MNRKAKYKRQGECNKQAFRCRCPCPGAEAIVTTTGRSVAIGSEGVEMVWYKCSACGELWRKPLLQ